MTERMTCDERFIALAKELNYDINGENILMDGGLNA